MMQQPEIPGFQAFQYDFSRRLRNPEGAPLPGNVHRRRMAIYEELLFNNLLGFVSTAFPITQEILGETEWSSLVRKFFIEHHCHSPLFRDIAGEFLDWARPQAAAPFCNRPWLWEFMHYEWLELAAETAPDADLSIPVDSDKDLMSEEPMLHPSVQLGCYRYPVHRICPQWQPTESDTGVYCFLVMRGPDDGIRFTQLSPASAQLMELLLEGERTGREAILQLAERMALPDPDKLISQGGEMLNSLFDNGAIIGTGRK